MGWGFSFPWGWKDLHGGASPHQDADAGGTDRDFCSPRGNGHPTEARRAHGSGAVVSFSTWRRLEARNYKLAACRNHLKPGLEAALQDMGTRCPHGHTAQNQPNFPASCTRRHRTGRGFRSRSPEGRREGSRGWSQLEKGALTLPSCWLGNKKVSPRSHCLATRRRDSGTGQPSSCLESKAPPRAQLSFATTPLEHPNAFARATPCQARAKSLCPTELALSDTR